MDITDKNALMIVKFLMDLICTKMVDNLETQHCLSTTLKVPFLEIKISFTISKIYVENWPLKHVCKIMWKSYEEIFN